MDDIEINDLQQINLGDIMPLYIDAGWINYTEKPDMLMNAYRNSHKILGAYDSNQLVGVIRVVGDGHSIIYVQDIIVLESYQRRGIGSTLLKQVIHEYSDVYQKILLTDNQSKTVAFYESLGFKMVSDFGCMAFALYNT